MYPRALDALTAEELACRDGVKMAVDRGYTEVIIETDSQLLVNL